MTPRKLWPAALLLLLCACRNNAPSDSYVLLPGGSTQLKLVYKSGRASTTNIGPLIVQTKKQSPCIH